MIKVQGLSKYFGNIRALHNISFEVCEGEIVGFLGQNGAGKTTCLRILCSLIPPSYGHASVAGHDVANDSFAARASIGYLPEDIPLYDEMKVKEYLFFIARLKGIPGKNLRLAVSQVMDFCDLAGIQGKFNRVLTKGFRQRVGLASALLQDPPVLLLDEPTVGLDPNQVRHVRSLIKDLGKKKTILFSTHILSEAEKLCDRVIILNLGQIVTQDKPENLRESCLISHRLILMVCAPLTLVKDKILGIPGVKNVEGVETDGISKLYIDTEKDRDIRSVLFQEIVKSGWTLIEMRRDELSLEDIFFAVTEEGNKKTCVT